jgi:diadenylate cyclase
MRALGGGPMTARIILYFRDVWANLRYADVLDVLVVAVLIYTAISWLRTARSRFVLTGMGVLAGLYAVARALDMYLTLLLFQAAIAVALFALVVIFQEDIRRAFELLGSTRPLRLRKRQALSADTLDAMVQAIGALAKQSTGALIVFKGREPLERHLSAGIDLDGRFSAPLLFSIFDTSSAGHDGAVIVEHDNVVKFGVHLPLAADSPNGAPTGTRHSAGLGLSERSDAFVVIVSEERATISVARNGRIAVVTVRELRARLQEFLNEVEPHPSPGGLLRGVTRGVGTKALSLLIAVGGWLVFFGSHGDVIARTLTVPVGYRNVPDGWVLDEPKPLKARVTLSGPDRAFQQLDSSSLMIAADVSHVRAGASKITIGEQDIELPPRITLHSVDPQVVTVSAYETIVRDVPVKPQTTGHLIGGRTIKQIHVIPSMIPIVMRKADIGSITKVLTEPIDLDSIGETERMTRKLDLPNGARLPAASPTAVEVVVELAPQGKVPAQK